MNPHTIIKIFLASLSLCTLVEAEEKVTKVACIGDSITFGARVKNRKENAYPAQLGEMLGKGWHVRNFGVGGTTMYQTKKRNSYWRSGQLKKIAAFNPDIITIMLGTNDANQDNGNWLGRERFIKDYKLMVKHLQEIAGKPTIYLCYPVPAYPGDRGKRELVLESEVLPGIDTVAKTFKLTVIDLFKPLSGKRQFFPDKIHPNAGGQTLIAQEILKILKPGAAGVPATELEAPVRMLASGKVIETEHMGYASPTWGDIDGDGKKDLIVGQYQGGKIKVYRNSGKGKLASGEWLKAGGQVVKIPGVW